MARKILLADDSVTAQNMGRKILTDAGYDVVTVNNGSAALKRIAESTPDLIILDVYMPGYSGLEVCQRLKEAGETAHIPVLLSVGKLEPFKPQEARRVRADAHIVKPFEASQLLTAIAQLEDAMVPQPHKSASRFASSAASEDSFGEGRVLGRGARLSGSKKRDAFDASSEISAQAATFRDFRKKTQSQAAAERDETGAEKIEAEKIEAGKAVAGENVRVDAVAPEPGPLAKLPGDITPEELSALSEVAAKLHEAPPADAVASARAPEEAAPAAMVEAAAPVEAGLAESHAAPEADSYSATATSAPEAEQADAVAPESAPKEIAEVAASEVEIPVAQVEPPPELALNEAAQAEYPQDAEIPFPEPVSTASFAEPPAPTDPQDEPMFASAAVEEVRTEEVAEEAEESEEVTAIAEAPAAETFAASAASAETAEISQVEEVAQARDEEPVAQASEISGVDSSFAQPSFVPPAFAEPAAEAHSFEASAAEFCAVEGPTSEAISARSMAPAAASGETSEPEAPMPSEAELAEALRLLTPATVPAEPMAAAEAVPVPHWSDEETMELPAARRWVAEALELTPEEAAMSLEAEMFRAFAANAEKLESVSVNDPLVAIQAAVEKRIAEEVASAEPAHEIAPKAMAAAAPNGNGSHATDEAEIASIVDRVMADLRPKIVEEIARKLAGK